MTSVDAFFATMRCLLEGRSSAAEAEAILGASPSGASRLARYPTFVHRQRRAVLDSFFVSVRAASAGDDAGRWNRIADAYIDERPPTHWEPNAFALGLPDFLVVARERGEVLPPYLDELVDYAACRYRAMVAGDDGRREGRGALGTEIFVRRYAHDVVTFAVGIEAAGASPSAPERRPTTVLLVRSCMTQRLLVLTPSLAGLVALARRDDASVPLVSASLAEEDVARADVGLVERGVLFARVP